MSEGKKADSMPVTAAWVAELRLALGDEWVNRALAASQQARREYARLAADQGTARADAWLARQKFPGGRFHAVENGHEVGIKAGKA